MIKICATNTKIYSCLKSSPMIQKFTHDLIFHPRFKSSPMIQKFTHNSKFYQLLQISPMIKIFANNYKFFFKSMLSFLYHEKYSFQIYRNTNNKNKEIQILELQKYNLQIYRNTNYRNTKY